MRSSLADMNMHNLRRWMKGRRRTGHLGARGTFHGLSPLHVRSERSPLHDVRQHACKRRVDATHCMREFVFMDEHSVAFAKALVSNSGSKFGLPTEAARPAKVGGARRNRTDDLLLAKQALSQLSYGPALRHQRSGNGGPGKI